MVQWSIVHTTNKINVNNNKILCNSTCCYPRVKSQINGNNGEATNTDDVRERARDRAQDKRIAQLTKAVERLSATKTKSKKKGKRPKRDMNVRNPFPGIQTNKDYAVERPINHPDPVVISAVAQLSPFKVPRGVSSILHNPHPSQKFTARALTSFTVPVNLEGMLTVSPSVCSDVGALSCFGFYGTRANLTNQDVSHTSYASGVLVLTSASTNTPYAASVLSGHDYKWRCVSIGVRVRNTSAAVSRFGVLKYLVDSTHTLSDYQAGETVGGLATKMDSSHKTVRTNMASQPDVEIAVPGDLFPYNREWFQTDSAGLDEAAYFPLHHGAIKQSAAGARYAWGCLLIQFPSVATAQSYDLEIVEHWEVSGSAIETLHTPSAGHSMVSETIRSVAQQALHQHSMIPHMSFKDVVKGVASAAQHKSALKLAAPLAAAISLI